MLNVDDFFAPTPLDLDVQHHHFLSSSGSTLLFEPVFSSSSSPSSNGGGNTGMMSDLANGSDAEDEDGSNGFNFLLDFENSLLANNTATTTATAINNNDGNDDTTMMAMMTTMSASSPSLSSSSVASLSSPSSSPSPMPLPITMPASSAPLPEQNLLFSPEMDLDSLMLGPNAFMQFEAAERNTTPGEGGFTIPPATAMLNEAQYSCNDSPGFTKNNEDEMEQISSSSPMSSSSSTSTLSSSPRSLASLSPPPKNRRKSGKSASSSSSSTSSSSAHPTTQSSGTEVTSTIQTKATSKTAAAAAANATTATPDTAAVGAKRKGGNTESSGTKRKREDTSKISPPPPPPPSQQQQQKEQSNQIEIKQASPNSQEDVKEAKRMRRLMKNRESAHASRERKRQYIESLEKRVNYFTGHANALTNRVCALENENAALRERLRQLEASSKATPATTATAPATATTTATTKTAATTTTPKLPLPPLRSKNSARAAPSFFGQFAPRFINGTLSVPLNQIPQASTIARNAAKATMLCIVLFAVAFMITNSGPGTGTGTGTGGSGGDALEIERAVSEAASAALAVENNELPHVRIRGRILHDFVLPTEEQTQFVQQALDGVLSSILDVADGSDSEIDDVDTAGVRSTIKEEEEQEEKVTICRDAASLKFEVASGHHHNQSAQHEDSNLPNCGTESPLISITIGPQDDATTATAITPAVNHSHPLFVASDLRNVNSASDSSAQQPITVKMEL